MELLKEKNADDVMVVAGGIIPKEDVPFLQERGINAIFGPGTPIKEIAEHIRQSVKH